MKSAIVGFLLAGAIGGGAVVRAKIRAAEVISQQSGGVARSQQQINDEVVSVKRFGAFCNGSSDDQPGFAAAIATAPSAGLVVDARSCTGGVVFGSSLTINKSGVKLLLPPAAISLGANQIVVPAGTHNVALVGGPPYGGSIASQTAASGTFLSYTGTGAAIQVGDLTADTYGFRAEDVTLGLTGAGASAIGVQLNRAAMYSLARLRVHGKTSANTQIAIDLEGGVQFTGGRIDDPYLWNGNTGIYYGKNANANYVVGGIIVNSSPGGGTCHSLAGDAAGIATGNVIIGTDCEVGAGGTVISLDYATKNYFFAVRNESVTNYVTASANSTRNVVLGWSTGAVTDNSTGNTYPNTIQLPDYSILNQSLWRLVNHADATASFDIVSGATTGQISDINFKKYDGTRGAVIRKSAADHLQILDSAGAVRTQVDQSGTTYISSTGTQQVLVNAIANSGTGGLNVYGGGASPASVARIDSTGALIQTGVTFANLGVPANGRILYCSDCTIANPCASGGTGAFAKRLNGVWVCN